MHYESFRRKATIAAGAILLGSFLGIAGARATSLLLNPGNCLVEDGGFVSSDGGCTQTSTGLTWSASSGVQTGNSNRNYSQAVSYCDALVEGEYSDWRSPTINELKGVFSTGGVGRLVITAPGYAFWSITTQGSRAWAVQAVYGDTGLPYAFLSLKTSTLDVVCVRSDTPPPPPKGRK